MSYTYPGVYIQELESSVHTIAGVATSITAFVGYTPRGIDNRAEQIFSFSDFERLFGGLSSDSELSYAVAQFFQNGGSQAYVVRTPRAGASPASVEFDITSTVTATFTALSSGAWANGQLLIDVDLSGLDISTATGDPRAFNLTITDLADQTSEYFPAVTLDTTKKNFVGAVVNDIDNGSQLVKVAITGTATTPVAVTGTVGVAITTGGAAGVNFHVGGSPTTTTALGDFTLTMTTSPAPTWTLPAIKVFGIGTPIPQTLPGLAAQLQSAINAVLAVNLGGASVQCSVSPVAGGGQGIRVNALLPGDPDAVVTFVAGNPHDAAVALGLPGAANVAHYALGTGNVVGDQTGSPAATDGTGLPGTAEILGDQAQFTGLYALQRVDLFNLLSIPDATRALPSDPSAPDGAVDASTIYAAAIALCDQRRAFLLIDPPPNVNSVSGAVDWKTSTLGVVDPNGAAFFPRLRLPDLLNKSQLRTFAPSGVVAGLYARIDASRGVWKAPAGTEATLNGTQSMTYKLNDAENGVLNPLGLNCSRTFPLYGPVMWGARTLVGADAMTSQWKYVPVRRLALFLEESLYRGTKWVVFEPNDEPLWAAIRLNVSAFMQTLFLKHAFQGQTPDQAYFVKCDSETTTQNDIDSGIVNILVGFAPLKPAEFVVIQIEQLAGQAAP